MSTTVRSTWALRRARLATFAFFILNGFMIGMWIVHIPVVKDKLDMSTTVLGWLLLTMGLGAFIGMQIGGRLADRFGSSPVVLVAAVLNSVAVVGPGLADSVVVLGAVLLVFGLTNGLVDVAMNTHAVEVERGYGRPIMGSFHAYWSIGGLIAALIGGTLIGLGVPLVATLCGAMVVGLAVTAAARPSVLRDTRPTATQLDRTKTAVSAPWSLRVLGLAVLAFILMLTEGVANDWSTVHLHETLGTTKATAAWAFGMFAAAMTVGRLVTDRIVQRVGRPAFVRAGAILASAGLAVAALAPTALVAIAGWTVLGIGLSGCVPQFFSAAGNVDQDASGTNLARVAGSGYVGLLGGPALIGGLSHWMPLPTTFWFPTVGCFVAGIVAGKLLTDPDPEPAD